MREVAGRSKNIAFRRLGLMIIFLIFSIAGMAQKSAHQIGLQLGLQHYATSEPILSPLHYQGIYLFWQPSYTYRGNRHYHRFQVARARSELTSSITSSGEFGKQHYVDLLGWQLQYVYLRKAKEWSKSILWIGGMLDATYFDKEIFFIYDWDGRTADAFIAPALALAATTQLREHHSLRGQFSIAPLAYVAARTYALNRPPLALLDKELTVRNAIQYGDWLMLPNFVNHRGELTYRYSLGRYWVLGLTYDFQYYQYDKLKPFNVRAVTNTLLVGVTFNL